MNHDLKWFMDAIEHIKSADEKRERLHAHAKYIRTALADLGYDVSGGSEQIIALEAGSEKNVLSLKIIWKRKNIGLYLLLSSYYKEKVKNQDGS